MAKIIVSVDHAVSDEKRCALVNRVADALGVLAEDVVLVPAGVSVSVVDVPADLLAARKKKDADEKQTVPEAE